MIDMSGMSSYKPNREQNEALCSAVLHGDSAGVRRALARGADKCVTIMGTPVLFVAAAAGNRAIFNQLLSAGADSHARDARGHTLLVVLATHSNTQQHLDIMKQVLETGLDANDRDEGWHHPLAEAIKSGNLDAACLLRERGARFLVSEDEAVVNTVLDKKKSTQNER